MKNSYIDSWQTWAHFPKEVWYDLGGAVTHVADWLIEFQAMGVPVAPQSHWQLGKAENAIRIVQEMSQQVIHKESAVGEDLVLKIVSVAASTWCRLHRKHGFSPAQWVLGQDSKLPGSLSEDLGSLPVHSQAIVGSEDFTRYLRIREHCSIAFHRITNDAVVRNLLCQGPRGPPIIKPRSGDVVFFWRGGEVDGKHLGIGRWIGPARVLGQDKHGFWMIYRATPVLANPDQVRLPTEAEKHAFDLLRRHSHLRSDLGGPGQKGFVDVRNNKPPVRPPSKPPQTEPEAPSKPPPEPVQEVVVHHEPVVEPGVSSDMMPVDSADSAHPAIAPAAPFADIPESAQVESQIKALGDVPDFLESASSDIVVDLHQGLLSKLVVLNTNDVD